MSLLAPTLELFLVDYPVMATAYSTQQDSAQSAEGIRLGQVTESMTLSSAAPTSFLVWINFTVFANL
jgi:hypothetical protein